MNLAKELYRNRVRRKSWRLILLVVAFVGVVFAGHAEEHPYQVRFGSLEISAEGARRYVFRWEQQEEVFEVSLEAILKASGSKTPGLPNLQEVGFRVASGKIYKYGNLAPDVFVRKFAAELSGEIADALVFKGLLEEDLILKLQGPTRVCRVDVVSDGVKRVLWKNIPEEPIKPK